MVKKTDKKGLQALGQMDQPGVEDAVVPSRARPGKAAGAKKGAKAAAGKRSRGTAAVAGDERARSSRAQESSEDEFGRVDEDAPYVRPTSLEAPAARPGYEQRWVRVGMGANLDERNWSRKIREGWRPRQANTVPKTFHVPRISNGRFAGYIGVEGMILCELPTKMGKRRRDFYATETARRTQAVDDDLRKANAGSQRGGFGPVKRAAKSELVRDPTRRVESGAEGGDGDEVAL